MLVTVPIDTIERIVSEIGGKFIIRGEEGIASFDELYGWVQECAFTLGPKRTIRIDEPVISDLRYQGKENRFDPKVQQHKSQVIETYKTQSLACEAMLVRSTKLHGSRLEELMNELEKEEYWRYINPSKPKLYELKGGWSVLEYIDFSIRYKTEITDRFYLVKDGAIFVPLSETL